ncbi:hypothetical protein [Magnetofaba australis]|uniref:hypothetical protein n=1 Tax=Magnetofaba australis TaxID=1472297 RepID=UPI001301D4AE|nr:hypothetical protein [Magnetofaba australis]
MSGEARSTLQPRMERALALLRGARLDALTLLEQTPVSHFLPEAWQPLWEEVINAAHQFDLLEAAQRLERLLETIEWGEESVATITQQEPGEAPLNADWRAQLALLRSMVAESDAASGDLINALLDALPSGGLRERLAQVAGCIGEYDMDSAAVELDALAEVYHF